MRRHVSEVQIRRQTRPGVVVRMVPVPVGGEAVVEEDDQTPVYVVTDGAASRRAIQVGIESGNLIEVVGGLSSDEEIVVTGQSSLRDGSKVLASSNPRPSYSG